MSETERIDRESGEDGVADPDPDSDGSAPTKPGTDGAPSSAPPGGTDAFSTDETAPGVATGPDADVGATAEFDDGPAPDAALGGDRAVSGTASIRSGPEPDPPAGLRWKSVAALGVCAFAAGIGVVVAPAAAVPAMRPATIEAMRSVALGLGAVAGLVGLVVAYSRSGEATVDAGPADLELPVLPERSHGDVNEVAGSRLDEAIAAVGGRVDGTGDTYTVFKLRNSLKGLAVRVVATSTDCSRETARERVERGTWTDDVRAAAFLGDAEAPGIPLAMRLRDWASGRALERRIEATVDELARLTGVDES